MKTTSTLIVSTLLSGCLLFEEGKISETCDELGTCAGISSGGIALAAKSETESRWSASVLDGLGDQLDPAISRDGQGEGLGPIVYDETDETIYIGIGESIRILGTNSTDKRLGIPPLKDGIPLGGQALFIFQEEVGTGSQAGFLWVPYEDAEKGTVWPIAQTQPSAIFPSADTRSPSSSDAKTFAVLFHDSSKKPSIAEFELLSSESELEIRLVPDGGFQNFDVMNGRSIDAFKMLDGYATCASTGAIFLVEELMNGNTDPERYNAGLPGGAIVACDYEEETDLVVLFSDDGNISWMDANNEIARSIKGPESYRIVHGSTW